MDKGLKTFFHNLLNY